MIKIQEIKLNEILPPILKEDKTVAAIAKVLQKYLDENYEHIKRLNILANIDKIANEDLIDHLAYQFHVDFYDQSLSISKKKKLVKGSIAQHRKKGTPGAVEELVSTLFGSGEIEEWFEYQGEPYNFKVIVDTSALIDGFDTFYKVLNTVKNTRSHLEEFIGKIETSLKLGTSYKKYDINYPMCGTYLCGTHPTTATDGLVLGGGGITLETKYVDDVNYYPMTSETTFTKE